MATNFQNKRGLNEGALQVPHIFDKSIKNNESNGHYWKGVCYRYGYGTDIDMNKSLFFFGESAARGSIMTRYELGLINYHGFGQIKEQAEVHKYLIAFILSLRIWE